MKSTFFDEIMKNVNRSGDTGDIVHTDSNPDYIPNYTHNFAYNLSSGAENTSPHTRNILSLTEVLKVVL